MTTKQVARRHHYLPQSYLASFTSSGYKEGQLYVLDVTNGHTFRTSPLNVAAERDFNRVDIEGHPPDAIENALSSFEGEAKAAIQRVIDTQSFPVDDDWNLIINLLGLIAVRNPKMRSMFNGSREQTLRIIGNMLASDKVMWEHQMSKARESGEAFSDKITFERFKRFVEESDYTIEFHPEGNLRVEFKALDKLLPLLGERIWSVLIAPPDGPDFICSDHPVALSWKSNNSGPVGFGLKNTEVFFPLSPRVGFYGSYEDPLKQIVICCPGNVATMNRRIYMNSERHVFSTNETFTIWDNGTIQNIQCKL
ncbi:MAG: DUF4238 domain-containing protein [Gammaproteobacteria bacterium]|nr:DUF4238 domain-containing protein [Gammaproteobacteria bacterium]